MAPTACKRTVSGSVSLPCSGFFSPFPHGTCSLSVSQEYLALADGAAGFRQDSSGPALLRVPLRLNCLPVRASHPLRTAFPDRSRSQFSTIPRPYYPGRAVTPPVWAPPRSLAATWGITFVFSSSGYLDVSVPRVRPRITRVSGSLQMGCPIRKSPDHGLFAPPRSLSQLITSFIASESQGIPRTLLVTFSILFNSLFLRVAPAFIRQATLSSLARLPPDKTRLIVKLIFLPACQRTLYSCLRVRVEDHGFEPRTPCLQSRCSTS